MGSRLNNYLRKDIFGTRNRPNVTAPERPNHKIEVKLLLVKQVGTIFKCLYIALDKDGMEITHTDQRNNVITVTGTPPENGYNADSVLAVVRNHDTDAQILSQSVLG